MIYLCIPGGEYDLVHRCYHESVSSLLGLEYQTMLGGGACQFNLGTDEYPAEESDFIHGDNEHFIERMKERIALHKSVFGMVNFAYLDAEFTPKGEWLQMLRPAPTPTLALIALRSRLIDASALNTLGHPISMSMWGMPKHTGGGEVSDAQFANARTVYRMAGAKWTSVNAYARTADSDHDAVVKRLAERFETSGFPRPFIPAVKLDIKNSPLGATAAHGVIGACLKHFGSAMLWLPAVDEPTFAMTMECVRQAAQGVREAVGEYRAARPQERP